MLNHLLSYINYSGINNITMNYFLHSPASDGFAFIAFSLSDTFDLTLDDVETAFVELDDGTPFYANIDTMITSYACLLQVGELN